MGVASDGIPNSLLELGAAGGSEEDCWIGLGEPPDADLGSLTTVDSGCELDIIGDKMGCGVCIGTDPIVELGLAGVVSRGASDLVVKGARFAAGVKANGGSFPWKGATAQL